MNTNFAFQMSVLIILAGSAWTAIRAVHGGIAVVAFVIGSTIVGICLIILAQIIGSWIHRRVKNQVMLVTALAYLALLFTISTG